MVFAVSRGAGRPRRRAGRVFVRFGAFLTVALVAGSAPRTAEQLNVDNYGYRISAHEVADIFFLDPTHGWLAVHDHARHASHVFETTDAGRAWRPRRAPRGLYHLYFLSRQSGWGLTYGVKRGNFSGWVGATPDNGRTPTYLVRTRDGGRTWARPSTRPVTHVRWASIWGLTFADSKHGWACGFGAYGTPVVLETSDGGYRFRVPANLPKNLGSCFGVYFRPAAGLWLYGGGFALHSRDLGKTWERPGGISWYRTDPTSSPVMSAFFLGDGRGWLVGAGPGWIILSTNDFGERWRTSLGDDATTRSVLLRSVWFSDSQHGCTVGNSTALVCTADGGLSWKARNVLPAQDEGQADDFTRVVMLSSGRGWVLRAGGFLYETTDSGETWRAFDPLDPDRTR